jgi:serine protease Do
MEVAVKRKTIVNVAVIFTVVGLILGLVLSSSLDIQDKAYTETPIVPEDAVKTLSAVSNAMVEVVAAVTPAVVNISTSRTVVHQDNGIGGFFNDPFFRRFFGDEFMREYSQPREEKRSSLGSGVIVDERGYILTNNHVIKDADEIKVTLQDKSEYTGKLIGTDPKTDLAVIKIEAKGLPAIKWGDSDALRVGEMVIAVGSPYGLNQTVTSGIVSAKGRANVRIADYEDFIQTDAAINPGNSGGPLINIRGELVGINTAIFSTTGGYQGIGFSIPSNMVRQILDSLIAEGRVVRGWLGVTIQPVTKELAQQFGLDNERGTLVSDVVEDSPAEKSGLKRGDIMIKFDGKDIDSPTTLRNIVAATAPGSRVKVIVMRDGKEKAIDVTIGELTDQQPGGGPFKPEEIDNVLKGVSVQDLTDELRKRLGVSRRVHGVVVTGDENGVGLRPGDVILELNRQPVESVQEYRQTVSKIKPGEDVLLLIYRDGGAFYVSISGD